MGNANNSKVPGRYEEGKAGHDAGAKSVHSPRDASARMSAKEQPNKDNRDGRKNIVAEGTTEGAAITGALTDGIYDQIPHIIHSFLIYF